MYPLLRPLLFKQDAESIHERTLDLLAWCSRHPGALRLLQSFLALKDPRLEVNAFGLNFQNPLALAAGMDKNARALPAWASLGFGAVEAGTVTARPQAGNPRPRLFRLPEDLALINRMGFNNEGAVAVARRLAQLGGERPAGLRLGLNVGKSLSTPLAEATADYAESLELLWPHADYLVLNVSSPNTPGLRQLQAREPLVELLNLARSLAAATPKPVLLKIAPDLSDEALAEICSLAEEYGLSGLIATNTTISRAGLLHDPQQAGGLSGVPLRARSLEVLRFLRRETALPLVSVGGVWDSRDVISRLRAGAVQVQLYTGYVYNGPGIVKRILQDLLAELEREDQTLAELIGSDVR